MFGSDSGGSKNGNGGDKKKNPPVKKPNVYSPFRTPYKFRTDLGSFLSSNGDNSRQYSSYDSQDVSQNVQRNLGAHFSSPEIPIPPRKSSLDGYQQDDHDKNTINKAQDDFSVGNPFSSQSHIFNFVTYLQNAGGATGSVGENLLQIVQNNADLYSNEPSLEVSEQEFVSSSSATTHVNTADVSSMIEMSKQESVSGSSATTHVNTADVSSKISLPKSDDVDLDQVNDQLQQKLANQPLAQFSSLSMNQNNAKIMSGSEETETLSSQSARRYPHKTRIIKDSSGVEISPPLYQRRPGVQTRKIDPDSWLNLSQPNQDEASSDLNQNEAHHNQGQTSSQVNKNTEVSNPTDQNLDDGFFSGGTNPDLYSQEQSSALPTRVLGREHIDPSYISGEELASIPELLTKLTEVSQEKRIDSGFEGSKNQSGPTRDYSGRYGSKEFGNRSPLDMTGGWSPGLSSYLHADQQYTESSSSSSYPDNKPLPRIPSFGQFRPFVPNLNSSPYYPPGVGSEWGRQTPQHYSNQLSPMDMPMNDQYYSQSFRPNLYGSGSFRPYSPMWSYGHSPANSEFSALSESPAEGYHHGRDVSEVNNTQWRIGTIEELKKKVERMKEDIKDLYDILEQQKQAEEYVQRSSYLGDFNATITYADSLEFLDKYEQGDAWKEEELMSYWEERQAKREKVKSALRGTQIKSIVDDVHDGLEEELKLLRLSPKDISQEARLQQLQGKNYEQWQWLDTEKKNLQDQLGMDLDGLINVEHPALVEQLTFALGQAVKNQLVGVKVQMEKMKAESTIIIDLDRIEIKKQQLQLEANKAFLENWEKTLRTFCEKSGEQSINYEKKKKELKDWEGRLRDLARELKVGEKRLKDWEKKLKAREKGSKTTYEVPWLGRIKKYTTKSKAQHENLTEASEKLSMNKDEKLPMNKEALERKIQEICKKVNITNENQNAILQVFQRVEEERNQKNNEIQTLRSEIIKKQNYGGLATHQSEIEKRIKEVARTPGTEELQNELNKKKEEIIRQLKDLEVTDSQSDLQSDIGARQPGQQNQNQARELAKELNAHIKRVQELETQFKNLYDSLVLLSENFDNEDKKRDDINDNVQSLLDKFMKENDDLKKKYDTGESYKEEIEKDNDNMYKKEVKQLKDKIIDLAREKADLEHEVKQVKFYVQNAFKQQKELKTENERQKNKIKELEEQLKSKEQLEQQQELEIENERQKNRIKELEEQLLKSKEDTESRFSTQILVEINDIKDKFHKNDDSKSVDQLLEGWKNEVTVLAKREILLKWKKIHALSHNDYLALAKQFNEPLNLEYFLQKEMYSKLPEKYQLFIRNLIDKETIDEMRNMMKELSYRNYMEYYTPDKIGKWKRDLDEREKDMNKQEKD